VLVCARARVCVRVSLWVCMYKDEKSSAGGVSAFLHSHGCVHLYLLCCVCICVSVCMYVLAGDEGASVFVRVRLYVLSICVVCVFVCLYLHVCVCVCETYCDDFMLNVQRLAQTIISPVQISFVCQ